MAMVTHQPRTTAQLAAGLFGVVFLLVGIAGFIPGLTTDYERLDVYDAPGAEIFGVFAVNWIHNGVHILFGLAGLAMAATHRRALSFLGVGGLIYLGLWIYGLVIDVTSEANFVALNDADNWLHLGLGVALLLSAMLFARPTMMARTPREVFEEQRRIG